MEVLFFLKTKCRLPINDAMMPKQAAIILAAATDDIWITLTLNDSTP